MGIRALFDAFVTKIEDPDFGSTDLRGAIFFEAPQLADGEFPIPARPSFQFAGVNGSGIFFVPNPGERIEVEITIEDPTNPLDDDAMDNPNPVYRSMLYSNAADMPEEFKVNYGNRMGWKTRSGHIILFDDTEGEEFLKIAHKIGTGFEIDEEGNWTEKIVKDKIVEILGKYITTITGDREITAANIKLTEDDGAVLNLNGGTVALGKGSVETLDEVVKSLQQVVSTIDLIKLITVPTAVGPSGVPINASAFDAPKTAINNVITAINSIKGSL